jgi:hypothetical protein
MAVRLSALLTGRALLPITIISLLLVLISVRGWVSPKTQVFLYVISDYVLEVNPVQVHKLHFRELEYNWNFASLCACYMNTHTLTHTHTSARVRARTHAHTHTKTKKLNSMVWVRERTIPTERSPLVGEVSANFGTHIHTHTHTHIYIYIYI